MTLFRRRFGFVPEGAWLRDEAPRRVRVGFWHLAKDMSDLFSREWTGMLDFMLRAARLSEPRLGGSAFYSIEPLLAEGVDFREFFEIVEAFAGHVRARAERDRYRRFVDRVNRLFEDENVGFFLDDEGLLQNRVSPEMAEAVTEALHATSNDPYAPFNQQLRRALEKLTFRKLDPTNAVKDAVGALEGALRVRFERRAT